MLSRLLPAAASTHLFHDGQAANLARVVALPADGVTIREEQNVIAIRGYWIAALCTTKAVDVPELRTAGLKGSSEVQPTVRPTPQLIHPAAQCTMLLTQSE